MYQFKRDPLFFLFLFVEPKSTLGMGTNYYRKYEKPKEKIFFIQVVFFITFKITIIKLF